MLLRYSTSNGYDVHITQGVITLAFKVFGIVVSIIVGIAAGGQPILGYNFGAGNIARVRKTMGYILSSAAVVGLVATVVFEFCPDVFLYIFGNGGDGVDTEAYALFTRKVFRVYMGAILLTCMLKVTAIFFQAIGSPIKSAAISLCRDFVVLVPVTILFFRWGGIDLYLWSAPVADCCGFALATCMYVAFLRKTSKSSADKIKRTDEQRAIEPAKNLAI